VLGRRFLEPAAEEAGVPWASFHSFRHTAASLLFERGANVKQVQRFLGHADPSLTLRTYIHLLGDDIGEPISLES
jgi:integrase